MTLALTHDRGQLDGALRSTRAEGGRVALVPTMGALHVGHAALIRAASERGDLLAVSIFVNPMQFGPDEDFDRYPRTMDDDLALCEELGVDVVFAPTVEEVYPDGSPRVAVDPGELGDELEGVVRPGHFRGVLTVVAKLFGLVRPDVAVFGEKDYQQLVLTRRMARDLSMGVDVVGVESVREDDGLALSSRNRYLAADERQTALAMSRSLRAGREAAGAGGGAVLRAAHAVLDEVADLHVDYLALRAPDLGAAPEQGAARLLVAGRVGGTRLIDNVALSLGPDDGTD